MACFGDKFQETSLVGITLTAEGTARRGGSCTLLLPPVLGGRGRTQESAVSAASTWALHPDVGFSRGALLQGYCLKTPLLCLYLFGPTQGLCLPGLSILSLNAPKPVFRRGSVNVLKQSAVAAMVGYLSTVSTSRHAQGQVSPWPPSLPPPSLLGMKPRVTQPDVSVITRLSTFPSSFSDRIFSIHFWILTLKNSSLRWCQVGCLPRLLTDVQKHLTMWPYRVSQRGTGQPGLPRHEVPVAAHSPRRLLRTQSCNCLHDGLSRSRSRKQLGRWRNAMCHRREHLGQAHRICTLVTQLCWTLGQTETWRKPMLSNVGLGGEKK